VEKLKMIEEYRSMAKQIKEKFPEREKERYAAQQLAQAARIRFPTLGSPKKLRNLLRDEDRLRELVHRLRLCADLRGPFSRKSSKHYLRKDGVGARRAGGGRKNKFLKYWQQVRTWHCCQRLCGLQVDTEDLWEQFRDGCLLDVKLLQQWKDVGQLQPEKEVWMEEIKDRVEKLSGNRQYRERSVERLMEWGGMKIGRPSRRTPMTLAEEKMG
jgi:hypothetical protein